MPLAAVIFKAIIMHVKWIIYLSDAFQQNTLDESVCKLQAC